jgi:hypothetical protein
LTTGARLRHSKSGEAVGYENRRGKVVAGGGLMAMGLFYAVLATAVSADAAAVLLPLSAVFVVLGGRTAYANVLQVAPPSLELRYTLHTKRVPLVDIDCCRPRTDDHSGRLRSEKTYPEIVMKDGRLIAFPLVQWLPENPDDPDDAAAACAQITALIRAAVPTR